MKRVLSLGDIYTTNDNAGDQCDDNDSTVFTQVKKRQHKKSKKTSPSTAQTRQGTAKVMESTAKEQVF